MRIEPLTDEDAASLTPDIVWDGQRGDLALAGLDAAVNPGGLKSEAAIATAVLICLATDLRVEDYELPPDVDNRGWAGDGFDLRGAERPLGSRLWTLENSTVDDADIPRRAETYAEEALETLIDQGLAVRADVSATARPVDRRLDLEVSLYGRDGRAVFHERFAVLWEQL